jgi:hypothetical protein
MAIDKSTKQSNYENDDFTLDIEKIYNDFIKQIDSIRSFANISNNFDFIKYLKSIGPDESPLVNLNIESGMQESRCHALFRLIGFPVISKDFKFYNPGHESSTKIDGELGPGDRLNFKIGIAKEPIDGFFNLSMEREKYYINNIGKIFSNNTNIDAGVLALSSGTTGENGINKRQFIAPFISSDDPLDINIGSYKLASNIFVGQFISKLSDLIDENNQKPVKSLGISFKHIVKPFITDPRIDFTVAPNYDPTNKSSQSRRICVPFIGDKMSSRVEANAFARRPLLEKVIIDRLTNVDQESSTGSVKIMLDYIKSVPFIKDATILQNIAKNDVYSLTELTKFEQSLKMIRSMVKLLVQASGKINEIQGMYYYLPIPSKTGPEGGLRVRNIVLSADQITATTLDKNIILQMARSSINGLNPQSINTNGNIDVGGFSHDIFDITFGQETSDGVQNNASNSLDNILNKRNKYIADANQALRTIEIIMGEFSGLGLCDIVAIMGALYIVPIENLLGMLDDDAILRGQKFFSADNINNNNSPAIETCITNFTNQVKFFYNLMDSMFADAQLNNGLSPT